MMFAGFLIIAAVFVTLATLAVSLAASTLAGIRYRRSAIPPKVEPQGVRWKLATGDTVACVDLTYVGVVDGLHEWRPGRDWPLGCIALEVDVLPARTRIVVAFPVD